MPRNEAQQFSKCNENYVEKMEEEENVPTKLFTEPINWSLLSKAIFVHVFGIYGLTRIHHFKLLTIFWGFLTYIFAGFGITAGAHRLWSHKSYKAKLPLQIILLVFYSMFGLNTVYGFVRDHRAHHKFTDTNADPHNSKRGFWFSHMVWLLQKKSSYVINKQATIDMSDITNDPLLQFQKKHRTAFLSLFGFVLPTIIPIWLWNEYWWYAVLSQAFIRNMIVLHAGGSVNSFAHMWGQRPYNKNIRPTDNMAVSFFAGGEGWHNYHHMFPWDYRVSEFGSQRVNLTSRLLDLFQKIGWVYDVKIASPELIKNIKEKYGEKNAIMEVPIEFADSSENILGDSSEENEKYSKDNNNKSI